MRLPHSLRSLRHRDLQLFFSGQAVSLIGTWMQSVAEGWLVYRLFHDAALLGWLGFLRQIPVFFLTAWAGSIADLLPRRKLVITTQSVAMVQAGLLAAVAYWHPTKPLLLGLAFLLGVVNAFDIPSRQSYLTDMAGADLDNAIAFNSTLVNGARIIGPALAGYVVAALGEALCFLLNSLSYTFVITGLYFTRTEVQKPKAHVRGHLREGFRYAWRTPHVRWPLLLMTTASLFAMPYVILMPVFAKDVFHGNASTQGRLLGAAGVGALLGAVSLLRRTQSGSLPRRVAWGATLLGCGILGFSRAPNEALAELALVLTGFGFMNLMAGTNTLLQTLAPPTLRGRVMGLFSMAFIGMGPWGALSMGYAAAHLGPRWALTVGALVLTTASLVFQAAVPGLEAAAARALAEREAPQPT